VILLEKLQYKVKHKIDFFKEIDFLETILKSCGVEDIKKFLCPSKQDTHDSFLLNNMKEAIELIHNNLNKKIFIKVDCDCDGFTSAAYLRQFLQKLNPDIEIIYKLDYNKRHGLFFEDVLGYDDLGLIIVPDASFEIKEGAQIQKQLNIPILVIDHHDIDIDSLTPYATVVNCMDKNYPNPNLSGVGVVHKVCLAYCKTYGLNEDLCNEFLDLVALGQIADSVDLRDPETRYYTVEGLKEYNRHSLLIEEMCKAYEDDMKFGHTIKNYGWVLAPRINGTIRYGKPEEQIDLFRAISGEKEDREYQPRRKSKNDPKPPIEIHSLQKTMARVCNNVKQRQDTEVRKFMEKIDKEIIDQNLDNNSVIVVNGTDILTKNTVTGLVANKLATKYKRPVLLLKEFSKDAFGGSGRNYDKGNIENLNEFFGKSKLFSKIAGHASAFGIEIEKSKIKELIDFCNAQISVDDLVTIHEVDYEIDANKLTSKDVKMVADSYSIWGSYVTEPLFAITGLKIDADEIKAYGENKGFIRFVYKGIPFIKKYCPKGDWEEMTLRDRKVLGKNTKKLELNLLCHFVLNEYEGKVTPQVKIMFYDSQEQQLKSNEIDDNFVF
jgi:single-stranded-DNA-specific exonuclease